MENPDDSRSILLRRASYAGGKAVKKALSFIAIFILFSALYIVLASKGFDLKDMDRIPELLGKAKDEPHVDKFLQAFSDTSESGISISPFAAIAKAKRAGGMAYVRNIYTSEMVHFAEMDCFEPDLDKLGCRSESKVYNVTVSVRDDKLTIRAEGNIDADDFLDVLVVNEDGVIQIASDDISNKHNYQGKAPGTGGTKPFGKSIRVGH